VAAAELMDRTELDPKQIDRSIFGVVVPALHAPNLGREVVFRASLPMETPGNGTGRSPMGSRRSSSGRVRSCSLGAPRRSATYRFSTRKAPHAN
jgi:acetyl-CoA acetyltransferase